MALVVGAVHMTQRGEDRDYNLKKDSVTTKNFACFAEIYTSPKECIKQPCTDYTTNDGTGYGYPAIGPV
jgi:hypothetical protein